MKSKNRLIARALGLSASFILFHTGAPAIAGDVEKAVDYRQGVMNVFSWNMKAMGDMMKGKTSYDQKLFAEHAQELATAAKLNVLKGFPEDSESDESDALPDIWMDFEDFEDKYRQMGVAAKALNEAAQSGDKSVMGVALKKAGKGCKACHKKYKN
ncbi:MAG: cytochrome c [Candidatus Thiodiazotropha sp. L084R]